MSGPSPGLAGWFADEQTGGTKYWDGWRWTGDSRPPRRRFAARSSRPIIGSVMAVYGVFYTFGSFGAAVLGDGFLAGLQLFAVNFVLGLALLTGALYLLRGRGVSTRKVRARLAAQSLEAQSRRQQAAQASALSNRGDGAPHGTVRPSADQTLAIAQVSAISKPATVRALQNLHTLLYTHAITEAEYQAAKAKVLGTQAPEDPYSQIQRLAELHASGILGDYEFAAAKARILGL